MLVTYRLFVTAGLSVAIASQCFADGPRSSGTGFAVTADGWILTNAHVVQDCGRIEVKGRGDATDPRIDETNDLAVVKVTGGDPLKPLAFRKSATRLGEDIVAVGYPLATLLADSVKITAGNVNALAGIRNDTRYLQISTPIQPGNSGGPVVDRNGYLLGITTATLSKKAADEIGITAQNVNFAIRSSVADLFMQSQSLVSQAADIDEKQMPLSTADLADRVTPSVFQILCYPKPDARVSVAPEVAPPPPASSVNLPASDDSEPSLYVPIAKNGFVRHPKGVAPLKLAANGDARTIGKVPNGSQVNVTAILDDWYRVEVHGSSGYLVDKGACDRAINGMSIAVEEKTAKLASARATLADLERTVTSVQPTVDEINGILASFGFTSFKLSKAGEKDEFYTILRNDGSSACSTLSEGERSFISFLYFYHLIRGNTSATGVSGDRVIVFDDPVSSLDSDVLFIVSALIKRVLSEARSGDGRIKQVFVLTHNIYFHKEVTFDPDRRGKKRAHETFWIVRKAPTGSHIEGFTHNPIRTSYELLWEEVRNPNRPALTIQNVLRRILEHYFTILGNMDRDSIISKFEGKDQQICSSLFSWINDGSHSFSDELYVSLDHTTVEKYLDVFKRIFEETGHGQHYTMMLRPSAVIEDEITPEAAAVATDMLEASGILHNDP